MGRKAIIPYGLYRAEGYVSAPLAERTGFGEDDLELLWEALTNMFEHDRSAARGQMSSRKLVIFKHENRLGNMHAHELFARVRVCRKAESEASGPARSFADYEVSIDREGLNGVEIQERL